MHKIAIILNASIEGYSTDSNRYWDKSHDSVPNPQLLLYSLLLYHSQA